MKKVLFVVLVVIICIAIGVGVIMYPRKSDSDEANISQNTSTAENLVKSELAGTTINDISILEDNTGVFPASGGVAEIAFGKNKNDCTIKLPVDYIAAGCYIDEDGTETIFEGLGSARDKIIDAINANSFTENHPVASMMITNLESNPTTMRIYSFDSTDAGSTVAEWKQYYPGGIEIGTADVPGYSISKDVYNKSASYQSNDFELIVCVQVSKDTMIEFIYQGGPLVDEVGINKASQMIYDLVTIYD